MVTKYVFSTFNAVPMRSGVYLVGSLRPLPNRTRSSVFLKYQTSGFSSSTSLLENRRPEPVESTKPPLSGSKGLRSTSSSTRSTSSSSPPPPSSSAVDAVNGPISTLPVALEKPEEPEKAGLSYYISLGRAYFNFYKCGVKNVWHNYHAGVPILQRLELSPFTLSKFPDVSAPARSRPGRPMENLAADRLLGFDEKGIDQRKQDQQKLVETLDRREFQLLTRRVYDTRKVIPLGIILLVCGEFSPLILGLNFITAPKTCVLPSHAEEKRTKWIKRVQEVKEEMDKRGLKKGLFNMVGVPADFERVLENATTDELLLTAKMINMPSKIAAVLPGTDDFMMAKILKGTYFRMALNNYLSYLAIDDALIAKAGGVKGMSLEEVRIAVEERGGVEVGLGLSPEKAETDMRWWLHKWVNASNK